MTATPADSVTGATVKEWYLGQTAGLWAIAVACVSGAVVGVSLAIDRGEPGYLLGVAFMVFFAVLDVWVTRNYAAIVKMDESGFSAVTVGLRRRSWTWSETVAEHEQYRSYGPVVSLRHMTGSRKVLLRRTRGPYDHAMRFAIEHAAKRVSFEAAVAERLKRGSDPV